MQAMILRTDPCRSKYSLALEIRKPSVFLVGPEARVEKTHDLEVEASAGLRRIPKPSHRQMILVQGIRAPGVRRAAAVRFPFDR